MNSIASIATVATGPSASREATMPAAMSIWLSTQPPKMWPLALMSPGRGATRSTGSRPAASAVIPLSTRRLLVMAAAMAEEDQPHQPGADEHGQPDAGDGRDDQVERQRRSRSLEIEQRQSGRRRGEKHHPAHHPLVAL